MKLKTFDERFRYLMTRSRIGEETFGIERRLNQTLYHSYEWTHDVRDKVILRDYGCDMGLKDCPITGLIIIHHINPLTAEDIIHQRYEKLYGLDNLVCVSDSTHKAIHYGDESYILTKEPIVRRANDTCPWKGL